MDLFTLCLHPDVSCVEFPCASVGGCKRYYFDQYKTVESSNYIIIIHPHRDMQLTLCCMVSRAVRGSSHSVIGIEYLILNCEKYNLVL